MEKLDITVEAREKSGKGVARKLRRDGKIPGVLYSKGDSIPLSLNLLSLNKVFHSSAGENVLINLKIEGAKKKSERIALIRDLQRDPITGQLLHVDLFEVSMDKEIRIKVPIEIIGDQPLGIKEGGMLQHNLREIEIECLPSQIPDRIPVDASSLRIGDTIHVGDLTMEKNIKVITEADQPVVTVAAPISEEKLEELLTAVPVEEIKEPEIVGKVEKELEAEEAKEKVKKEEKAEKVEIGEKAEKEKK